MAVRSADGYTHIFPWRTAVTKLIRLAAAAGLALGIAGCASPSPQVAQKGDLLTDAGFMVRIADSPHRVEQMKRLPPNKFVTRVRNGQLVYLYADPMACRCVYFGTQQNWDAYRQAVAAQQIAKENEMSATEMREDWDFGLWALPSQGGPL